MSRDRKPPGSEDEAFYENEEEFEKCPVCHQEFANGVCPIRSADCPYLEDGQLDEEEDADFEDVEKLDAVLEEDEEADRVTEEAEEEALEDPENPK